MCFFEHEKVFNLIFNLIFPIFLCQCRSSKTLTQNSEIIISTYWQGFSLLSKVSTSSSLTWTGIYIINGCASSESNVLATDQSMGTWTACLNFIKLDFPNLNCLFCCCRFLEELEEGIFIQQTLETLLINADGKQLMVGAVCCSYFYDRNNFYHQSLSLIIFDHHHHYCHYYSIIMFIITIIIAYII